MRGHVIVQGRSSYGSTNVPWVPAKWRNHPPPGRDCRSAGTRRCGRWPSLRQRPTLDELLRTHLDGHG